ncbi:MAG: ankyrin repeat domain-containing protein [Candidatus Anstonellales archaeon]
MEEIERWEKAGRVGKRPNLESVLLNASYEEKLKLVKRLIDDGANVNVKSSDGSTPLILTTSASNEKIVETLLNAGADVNTKNNRGNRALCYAFGCCRAELPLIKLLVEAGADVNIKTSDGRPLLCQAVGCCQPNPVEAVKMLLEKGADLEVRDKDKSTPILCAVSLKAKDTVELLLEEGANPFAVDYKGKNAYDLADNEEIKKMLKDYEEKLEKIIEKAEKGGELTEQEMKVWKVALHRLLERCDKKVYSFINYMLSQS